MIELAEYSYDWWSRAGLNYPAVWIFTFFWVFAFGACWGSFLNVCIWRIPRNESIIHAPSHCTGCGADIRWFDNLPVISYLVLRGRCRCCRQPYTPRYLLVELLCGVLFTGLFIKIGYNQQPPQTIVNYWIATLLFVSSAWIDAEHRIIPDKITYPAMLLGLISAFLLPEAWESENHIYSLITSLLSGAIPGAGLALFAFLGQKFAKCEVLGWGDVKFIIASGILLGWPGVMFTLFAGSVLGMIYGIGFSIIQKCDLKSCSIPFAPFLCAGGLLWTFAGKYFVKIF